MKFEYWVGICSRILENFQLDLAFKTEITQWSESRRTRNHTLLSHLILSQPEGTGPRIYISQEQGGPVIPPGTEFPLRLLLRPAGLRWRYSKQPLNGIPSPSRPVTSTTKFIWSSELLYGWRSVGRSVSQSVCLGIEHLCETYDQILLPVGIVWYGF
jgi:hypothetical protein